MHDLLGTHELDEQYERIQNEIKDLKIRIERAFQDRDTQILAHYAADPEAYHEERKTDPNANTSINGGGDSGNNGGGGGNGAGNSNSGGSNSNSAGGNGGVESAAGGSGGPPPIEDPNANWRLHRKLAGHSNKIYAIRWCPKWDEQKWNIVSASQDGNLVVWNVLNGSKQVGIPLKIAWVMTCGYSPNGMHNNNNSTFFPLFVFCIFPFL